MISISVPLIYFNYTQKCLYLQYKVIKNHYTRRFYIGKMGTAGHKGARLDIPQNLYELMEQELSEHL